jgi:imidazolonepropionase-like amidohydrolase
VSIPFRALAAAALAAAALLPRPGAAAEDGALLVRAGTVIPVEGEPISAGAVLCRDGKIEAVGRAADVRADDARVVDLGPDAVILPGLVAVSSGLAAPGAGAPQSVAPEVRALDAFDWFRPRKRLLEGGVTTAYLDAGRRRVVGGQAAVVKLAGASPEARTLLARAGLFGAVGDPARNPPALFDAPTSPDPIAHPLLPVRPQSPGSRMAAVAMLREALARGKAAGAAAEKDPGLDALAAVATGREPLRVQAVEAADIEAAISLAKEAGVRLVLGNARDAGLTADRIAEAGALVALESPFVPGRVDDPFDREDADRRAAAMGNPAALEKRGVTFAIGAADAALPDLLLVAAAHVRAGLSPERALRAVTLDAARVLGVEGRVGSLVPGKDADLVAISGNPFDVRSTAVLTVVDGKIVFRREAAEGVLVIRAAAVHTGTGEVFAPGAVVLEGGKVVEAGPDVGVPTGARILDRRDGVVLPGLLDSHSRLGLRSGPGNLTTATSVAQALVPDDPSFAAALGAGITTTLVSPGGGGPVVGTVAVVKTAGGSMAERTLRESAGVEVSLAGSGDLPASLQGLRETLQQAKQHHEAWEKYEKELKDYEKAKKEWEAAKKKREEEAKKAPAPEAKPAEAKKEEPKKEDAKKEEPPKAPAADEKKEEPKKEEPKKEEPRKEDAKPPLVEPKEPAKPGTNPALDAWRDVFRKKVPVLCRVASAAEASGALKVFKEEAKVDLVLVQGDDAWRVAADLKKAGVGVLLGPRLVTTVDGKTVNAARGLAAAGVPFGLASDAGYGSRDLPLLAAWAVRHGLGPSAAVKALTLDAARLLGVADRVGSLEPGKDADLVILSGDPFDAATRVRAVYVGGKVVYGAE